MADQVSQEGILFGKVIILFEEIEVLINSLTQTENGRDNIIGGVEESRIMKGAVPDNQPERNNLQQDKGEKCPVLIN